MIKAPAHRCGAFLIATMEYDELNETIKRKVAQSKGRLLARMQQLGMKHGVNKDESERLTKLITTTREVDGLISRIRYRFKRSGVFVHKGVGKGRPATNPGTPKEWFNPVIEEFADELAEEVLEGMLEVSYSRLKIK